MDSKLFETLIERKNDLTEFIQSTFAKNADNVAYILDTDMTVKTLKNNVETKDSLVEGASKKIAYIKDDNFEAFADKDAVIKEKPFNFLAFLITDYYLYGKVLIIKKE